MSVIVHNAGKEFKQMEMLLFHCTNISRNLCYMANRTQSAGAHAC